MITLAILIAIIAVVLFGAAICIIVGGVAGLGIVCDIIVAIFIIGLMVKILFNR